MKEWLIKMAKELGLAADATEEQVLAKLSERFAALSGSDKRLSALLASAPSAGVKVEGDKLVKVEASTAPRNPDDVAKLAAQDLELAKSRIQSGKLLVEGYVKAGKVPPSMKDALDRVFTATGKLESVQLGKGENNSEVLIKGPIEILEELKKLFDGLPKITGGQMSTLSAAAGQGQGGQGQQAGALGRAVAARNKPQPKKEPAAK